MYRGYNLESNFYNHIYEKIGELTYKKDTQYFNTNLNQYLNSDGSLSGSAIETDWFPEIQADVFISHSHGDLKYALTLAGWLYREFKLRAFIDSTVWGHADNLLKSIDYAYCYQPASNTYSYKLRNFSTAHVHMMLATSLSKMIQNCECLIFLNTPNSISVADTVTETESPWIYHEIFISKIIEKYKPNRNLVKAFSTENLELLLESIKSLRVKHRADIGHLTGIDETHLFSWQKKTQKLQQAYHPLDILYKITE